ncbi:piggyBac transposable element-derived protein 3-like [Spodoptera frugiperda]|uniref:PiggyBac transposable element-derived protein 3-like n=1 Tax=Spodoptera frugiperda TaxID=7108 RepID=A0A9R0ETY4_SPOFR|nr:piggyBac transposable element-derived protein 3-like [Spodoptera frugiperda]
MDPRRFYGGIHTILKDFPDSSADEDLSDDEQLTNRRRKVLPPLCIPESEESDSVSDDNIPLSHLASSSTRTSRAEKPRWRDGFLERAETDLQFTGDISLPLEITTLNTPYQFFKYLFTDDIFLYISQETNKYAVEKRPEKPSNITVKELEQFIGICLYMSIVQLPSTRFYWNEDMGYPKVSTIMSCNRFEEIKRFIHFNDNLTQIPKGQPGHNPLHKIQPLLELLRQRILTVPKEQYMAVDEQIIPTKSRSSMRQYNPKKPHKWGYKNFVLSGSSGFSFDFEIYTGAQGPVQSDTNLPKISTSSDVVVRLSRTIPEGLNYKLFFDNWYTSLPLLTYLNKKGILPIGTIKANRIPGYKVPVEKDLKKKGRGTTVEKLTTIDNTDISVVTWYDNRVVNLASTYVGSKPSSEVRRFNKKEKTYQNVSCPKAVTVYNRHMGGVDLLDALLGYYRIQIRSKKFYHRIFFHMIDMMTVNAWLLYRRTLADSDPYLPFSRLQMRSS